jgi:hypothetical protein
VNGFIEYVTEMSRSDKRELRKHVRNLLSHRLKIKYVAGESVHRWRGEVRTWENELFKVLDNEPGLKSEKIDLSKIYVEVVTALKAQYRTARFPNTCPFTLEFVVGNRVWNELKPTSQPDGSQSSPLPPAAAPEAKTKVKDAPPHPPPTSPAGSS